VLCTMLFKHMELLVRLITVSVCVWTCSAAHLLCCIHGITASVMLHNYSRLPWPVCQLLCLILATSAAVHASYCWFGEGVIGPLSNMNAAIGYINVACSNLFVLDIDHPDPHRQLLAPC